MSNNEVTWSEDQQKVIDLRNRNILVSAAAGSGKTAVLVVRIIDMITDESYPINIDQLLVVTFTKAAAAEMKSRVSSKLEEKLMEHPDSEHIQKQLSLLHNAQITTIDSFCQYIIRNYFHVIGLDPVFRVADEKELKVMRREVLREVLEEKYASAKEHDEREVEFADVFATGRTDDALEDLILNLYDISMSYPWPKQWLEQCAEMYQCQTVEEMETSDWMQQFFMSLKKLIANYIDMAKMALQICSEPDGPSQYTEAVQSDIDQLEDIKKADSYQKLYEAVSNVSVKALSRKKNEEMSQEKQELVKSLREMYMKGKGLQDLMKDTLSISAEDGLERIQKMSVPVNQLIAITKEFLDAYQKKKEEEGIIDFADMEHFALQILVKRNDDGTCESSDVAKELQEQYVEVLTDEYQDSNFVQEMILSSLIRAPKEAPYYFMVGDIKQSIYQFRLARPQLFLDKYSKYTKEDSKTQKIDLQQNYRSRDNVLQSANTIFRTIMTKDLGGIEYDQAAELVPGAMIYKPCEHDVGGKTELLLADTAQEVHGQEPMNKVVLEATMVGRRIWDLVHQQPAYYVMDQDYRPVEYRDIVILLRSQKGWTEPFVETLMEMGIPVYADTQTGYFTALEIETVLNFLRTIDNPRQDISLAAVLHSCIVGLTDEEMGIIAALPRKVNYWDAIQTCLAMKDKTGEWYKENREKLPITEKALEQLIGKLEKFVQLLTYYQEMAQTASVFEILNSIYRKTGYYDIMTAMPAGERRAANLDILLQRALEFAEYGYTGVFSFTRYIETLKKADIDYGEASVLGENMNAVRIMSIHKSKGLEFPVVFVAGLGKAINLQDARKTIILDNDYGVGVNYVDLEKRFRVPTLIKKFMAMHITENTLAEEIRILYVALTRAKEKLILTGTIDAEEKVFEKWRRKNGKMTYADLMGVNNYLDWLGPVILNDCLHKQDEDAQFSVTVKGQDNLVMTEVQKCVDDRARKDRIQKMDLSVCYDEEMGQAFRNQTGYEYQYKEENKLPIKISVTEYKRRYLEKLGKLETEEVENRAVSKETEEKIDDIPKPAFLSEQKEETAAQKGTLYHMVMEHMPYEKLGEEDMLQNYINGLVTHHFMTEKEKTYLDMQKFSAFLQSDLGKRMQMAQKDAKLKREQPFVFAVPAKEVYDTDSEEKILVQGIIDACFLENGKWVLVDYKTDFVQNAEQLKKRYFAQLDMYAQALTQITGIEVSEKIIYSFCLGQEILLGVD